jgi:hypothetical protein
MPAETQNDVEDEVGYDGNEKGVCGRDEMKSAS